jgi:hypothetical protein
MAARGERYAGNSSWVEIRHRLTTHVWDGLRVIFTTYRRVVSRYLFQNGKDQNGSNKNHDNSARGKTSGRRLN